MFATILKCLEKVDFLKLSEALRGRNNRQAAARLFLALTITYEIIEIFEVLVADLKCALESNRRSENACHFTLNPYRISELLKVQADNLGRLDHVLGDLYQEIRILSPEFERTLRQMGFGTKFTALLEAQIMLADACWPLNDEFLQPRPDMEPTVFKLLTFSSEVPSNDWDAKSSYGHAWAGTAHVVVDIPIQGKETFFEAIGEYFTQSDPFGRIERLRATAETYRAALEKHFTLSDLLSDIGSVKSRYRNS